MSDNVSLARPPGALMGDAARPTDVEPRPALAARDAVDVHAVAAAAVATDVADDDFTGRWFWDVYFAVALVGVTSFVLGVERPEPLAQRVGAAGLLLAIAVWYVTFGRRILRDDDRSWRGYVYLTGVVVLYAPAVTLVDSTSFALFGLCPQAYMALSMAAATAFVTVLSMIPAAVVLIHTGDLAMTFGMMVPFGLVIIAFSTVTAMTIIKIERRSAERADLIKELASTRAEVARLSHEAGIAAERQRLAGEIHDTVAQGLSSVVMLVQAADAELTVNPEDARRHLALAASAARENLDEARALVGALTPAALAETSLIDALRRLSDKFATERSQSVVFTCGGEPRQLSTGIEVVLLRAAQEALNNVRKHSEAGQVSLRLLFGAMTVVLEVSDDGCGFVVGSGSTGYGLGAMRSRVEQIGGVLSVHSAPGAGTTVRTEVPA